MKKIVLTLTVLITILFANENKTQQIYDMSNTEIDNLLKIESQNDLTITDRINLYSEIFLGMPYSWTATGDGPYALLETYPLVDFDSTNCMVYCEHVLAMSISDSWDNFFNNLQQIRYKDGIIGMRTRNHYTIGDWLPENNWILNDVSKIVGGKYSKEMTRTISHKSFFKNKGITDLRYVKKDRTITIDFVPLKNLDKVKDNVKNGDIVALLFANKDDIFSAHMLMIVEKNGVKYFREASTSNYSTFETTYDKWVNSKLNSKKYAGMVFMRVKTELDKKNAVILPWEIGEMKK
ncbi:MAG: DUF1460 domain-containing protein [Candidatus Marinimicrobia bacterium]|nr:DUF1460 domain-containing protein [Candidatus Neomarinimicrobiota bacterium]